MMRAAIVAHALDAGALLREVASPEHGATALFVGSVRSRNAGREVTGISYSSYAAMAESELHAILAEASERFGGDVVVEHRTGELAVGDVSVVIAAAHERRTAAMDAMRYVIEELKRRVPVWKMEHYADGTREWVDPTKVEQL